MTFPVAALAELAHVQATPKFAEVFREHFDFVWRSVRRLGIGEDAVDDVVQEVFLVVHRRLDEFEGRSTMRSWLYGITIRIVRNHRRSKSRRGVPVELPETMASGDEASPHQRALRNQASEALLVFLESLSEERREVFVMVDLEQESVVDAAAALEINVNTAHGRLRAARDEFDDFVARFRARDGWRQR